MKGLSGRRVLGLDGDAGFIAEVYFDDKSWQVRYLLVDTNNPMPRHEVLVPSASIAEQASGSAICVRLTRKQIKQCPEKEADPPVWYQHDLRREANYKRAARGDPHLRSGVVVLGYAVHALDGHIGHVDDLLIDGGTWRIAYLVVDLRNWVPGRRVLVPPDTVQGFDWPAREIHLGLTRAQVRRSPAA